MFSNEELKNLGAVLNRVNLTGKEALAIALLQQKVSNLIVQTEAEVEKPVESATDETIAKPTE